LIDERFSNSKKDIVDEIDAMLKVSIVTAEQKKELISLKALVQGGSVQLECATKACEWPEY